MRMPILSYFVVIGTTLLLLLTLSSYALPDVGSPIKTSQLTGLPKVEPRPDAQPMMPPIAINAPKEPAQNKLPDSIYAKAESFSSQSNAHPTKQQASESKNRRSAPQSRVAASSYDAMLAIH